MDGDRSINHLQTSLGVIACVVIAVPASFIGLWLAKFSGVPIGSPEDSWLPYPIAYFTEILFPCFVAGTLAGFLAIAITRWILKQADRHIVAYATAGVFGAILIVLGFFLLSHGGPYANLIQATAQILGFAVGLFVQE